MQKHWCGPKVILCQISIILFHKNKTILICYLSLLISKVIICTDGKANTELGNLEVEDNDARTLLSSTIFYQELGEYAANQGFVPLSKSMSRMALNILYC